jgi:hypothetical protein
VGDIPPPPKYQSADFLNNSYWCLRGALDVPKERFVSYPHCSRHNDPALLVGWAGWDHLQQAQALAGYYTEVVEREGWPVERLKPLLAGLAELLPGSNSGVTTSTRSTPSAWGTSSRFPALRDPEARADSAGAEPLATVRFEARQYGW